MPSSDNETTADGWDRAAQRIGLQVEKRSRVGSHPTRLTGVVAGVEVTVSYHSAKTEGSSNVTRYAAVLPPGPWETLELRVQQRRMPRLWKRSPRTGDDAWDRRFTVRSTNPEATELFLTPERRAAFVDLLGIAERGVEFTDGTLTISTNSAGGGRASEDELVAAMRALLAAAYRIQHGSSSRHPLIKPDPLEQNDFRPGDIKGSDYQGPAQATVYCRTCNLSVQAALLATQHTNHAIKPPKPSTPTN